ncbi:hypothetical protein [Isoptericola variabilis]|uniref:DUF4190 domain-containing protein n=1 Tax=Isoptericola variabilis (strain 225) TaxID=743718 RepID=F6FPD8_ISOV2|nr:hypothetical protein [Isoptericola variabilis]AEG43651.1 hypothetical protein Isova_0867 [Isoptericola variabilis 225]TWH27332.1 hypothetical protein L600_000500000050 [Isoptericola variabilis J7]TWH31980.1 hypothetical protein L600_000200000040 [Isoptericola variabilis J7]
MTDNLTPPMVDAQQAPTSPRGNGLAVAGFVTALVALALSLVPIINNAAFVLALVGLGLAVGGVIKARRGAPRKGLAIAGIIIAVLAGAAVLASQAFYGSVMDEVSDSLDSTPTVAEEDDAAVEGDAASAAPEEPAEPSEEAAPEQDAAEGTRANPYTVGETVSNDEWTVTLGQPYEAWEQIRAENEFNEPPADGMEYWIVPLEATYTGSESATAWVDLTVRFVGEDSVTYDDISCGVIPDDLSNVGELYEGGTAAGNVCLVVPAGAPGLWTLTAGWFADPVFFAVG